MLKLHKKSFQLFGEFGEFCSAICQRVNTSPNKTAAISGLAGAGIVAAGSASAVVTLDPAIATGFTTVQDNFAALLGLAYPYMVTITTGLIIFGLVKMFIHKGAGK